MTNSTTLYYETAGKPTNPCVVLIMGIGGQLINWPKSFMQYLVDNDFYVISFDNRDTGLSKHYEELTTLDMNEAITLLQQGKSFEPPYTLANMADDVADLLTQLKIKQANILGCSMGGMIAQHFANRHAEKTLSLNCLYSSSGEPGLPSPSPEVMEYFFSPKRASNSLEDYVNDKLALYKLYNHPDYFDEAKAIALHTAAYQRDHSPSGFKRQLLALMTDKPRTTMLKSLTLPSLIVHGDYDPLFSIEHGKQLADSLLNSQFVLIKKLGHGLPEGLVKTVAEPVVRFLKSIKQESKR